MQEFDVNIRAIDVNLSLFRASSSAAPEVSAPGRSTGRPTGCWSRGVPAVLSEDGVEFREQEPVDALGRGGGWATGAPHRTSSQGPGRSAEERRERRVRPGGGAGAEVTVPAPGRSPERGGRGLAGGKERAGARAAAGGGAEARGRGGGGGARDPLSRRPPCTRSPGAAAARPQPTRGRNFLRSRAPEKSALPSDDRRQRPSGAPRVRGLPSRGAGSAPDLPAAERGVPSAGQGALPAARASADSEGRGLPRRAARAPRRLPRLLGTRRRLGGISRAERAGPRMKSPVRRPEQPAR